MRVYMSVVMLFFCKSCLWVTVCAKESKAPSKSSLNSLVQGIISTDEVSPQVVQQMEKTVQKLEEEISSSTSQIKASVEAKVTELQTQADVKSKEIFQHCAGEVERLQLSVVDETQALKRIAAEEMRNLRRTAADRLIAIADQVEAEAFMAKQETRRKFLEQRLASYPNGESDVWKEQLKEDFDATIAYLKPIVEQGESPEQAEDFMKRFDAQTSWFNRTLATTHSMSDQGYYQLHQKVEALTNIVAAQKSAEADLERRYKKLPDDENYKKLRLLALYEINDLARKKSGNGAAAVASTVLSSADIDTVINKVISPVPVKKQVIALNDKDQKDEDKKVEKADTQKKEVPEKAPSLESIKLAELAEKVDEGKAAILSLVGKTTAFQDTSKLVELTEKIDAGKVAILSLVEKTALNTQQAIDTSGKKIAENTTQQVSQKLGSQFEHLNKDQLELHSIILDTQQRLAQLNDRSRVTNLDVTKTLLTAKESAPQDKETFIRLQEARNKQNLESELESMQNKTLAVKL